MTVIAKPLITAQDAPNAQTTLYTAPGGTRVPIDKFTAYNHTDAPADLSVNLVPNGRTAAAANHVAKSPLRRACPTRSRKWWATCSKRAGLFPSWRAPQLRSVSDLPGAKSTDAKPSCSLC
jgi:hypothetical protein